jgi:hypothetical protein
LISSAQAITAAGAVHHHLDLAELAARQKAGVDEAGGGDDGGAVLVVVEDGNVHPLPERGLDHEAFGRGDVLEVDAAEARFEQRHRVDEGVGVLGRHFEVDRVDVGEPLEQHRLAFHHRLRRQRAEIAEAENRGAVGDDGDEVALGRQVVGANRIGGDGPDRNRDAWRIGEAEVALALHGLGGDDLELAGAAAGMEVDRLGLGIFDVALAHCPAHSFASGP